MKQLHKKEYPDTVDTCEMCLFFTLVWRTSERKKVFHKNIVPCYICDHPSRSLLELPNIILSDGKPVSLKEYKHTWKYPKKEGISIPDWCPLHDYKDPGVRVGCTAIIIRDGKVLLGLRGDKCQTAKNEWAYPGGRMDYGENPITTLLREILEETTMIVEKENLEFLTWTNEFFPDEEKHYVSLVFLAKNIQGEPKIIEPDKCKEWRWFNPDALPENTFWACIENVEKYRDRIKNG